MNNILTSVVFTAAVFAALVTSIANIIISLINGQRLKNIEMQKQLNEIDKYRYSRLYELVLNWHQYDSDTKEETASEIAFYKLLNLFLDDSGRYDIAKPLLDESYVENLEIQKVKCEEMLNVLIEEETQDGTHTKQFPIIRQEYFSLGEQFSKMLKEAINSQLEELLRKSIAK